MVKHNKSCEHQVEFNIGGNGLCQYPYLSDNISRSHNRTVKCWAIILIIYKFPYLHIENLALMQSHENNYPQRHYSYINLLKPSTVTINSAVGWIKFELINKLAHLNIQSIVSYLHEAPTALGPLQSVVGNSSRCARVPMFFNVYRSVQHVGHINLCKLKDKSCF